MKLFHIAFWKGFYKPLAVSPQFSSISMLKSDSRKSDRQSRGLLVVLALILVTCSSSLFAQNMSINNTGAKPDSSAMLDVQSTTQGFLTPRMSTVQMNNIVTPAEGLMIYNIDSSGFYFFDGVQWMSAGSLAQNLSFVSPNLSISGGNSLDLTTLLFEEHRLPDTLGIHLMSRNMVTDGNWINGDEDDEGIFITTNGSVGIGTSTPTQNLDVVGTAEIDSLRINNSYGLPTTDGSNGQVMQTDGAGNVSWQNSGVLANILTGTGTPNRMSYFYAADSIASYDDVFIDTTNNRLGIGTAAPQQKLHVVGSARVSAGFLANNGTAGSPSYRFDSDANTGMYNAAADQLGFTAGGTQRLLLSTTGMTVGGTYTFPYTDGTNGQVMQTDGSGAVTWITPAIQPLGDTTQIADSDNNTKIQVEATTNENLIRFKVAGTEYFRMDSGHFEILNTGGSVFIGENAGLNDDLSSNYNTFVGTSAGMANTWGSNNTFSGYYAGYSTTSGSDNTFSGSKAGYSNTTGTSNVFSGFAAGYSNTSGGSNVFSGYYAGYSNTTSSGNTFTGMNAGRNNTTGSNNVFSGYYAGYSNTSGINNIFSGYNAGRLNTTGGNNTFSGNFTGYSNTTGSGNTFNGSSSGYNNTTGGNNVFSGYLAGYSNTTGGSNVFSGYRAGFNNITGSNNIFFGVQAGNTNTSGLGNVGFGTQANYYNETGNYNTAIGYQAGRGIIGTSKTGNVYLGYQAGYNDSTDNKLYIENSNSTTPLIYGDFAKDSLVINGKLNINGAFVFPTADGSNGQVMQTDGSGNVTWASAGTPDEIADADNDTKIQVEESVDEDIIRFDMAGMEYFTMNSGRFNILNTGGSVFIGQNAGLNDDLSNNYNTFVGTNAGMDNTTGANNTFSGYTAGYNNTTGSNNTFSGYAAGYYSTTGSNNTFTGYYTGIVNTTGFSNTFTGSYAGNSNTTGSYNIFSGSYAGYNNTTGSNNTFSGIYSGRYNTTGSYNTLSGYSAGYNNTTGGNNTFSGYNAGYNNTTGGYNTFFGNYAGFSNTIGASNIALGYYALRGQQTGNNNVALGYQAGYSATNHSKEGNIYLGYRAGYGDTTDNKLYIENSANITTPLIYGDFNAKTVSLFGDVGIGTKTPGYKLHLYGTGNQELRVQTTSASDATLTLQNSTNYWSLKNFAGEFRVGYNASELFTIETSGEVGIGTINPTSMLEVVGDVKIPAANDYTYSTAKTGYVSISAAAFTGISTSATVTGTSTGNRRHFSGGTTGVSDQLYADVQLPHGAVVTNITAGVYDADATYDVDLDFTRKTLGAVTNINTMTSTAASTGSAGAQAISASSLAITIDNSSYAYYVVLNTRQNTANLGIMSVSITYTVTKAD